MESERWIALIVLGVSGVGAVVLGVLGRQGRVRYVLGAMRESDATPAAWDRAHRRLGGWFMVSGVFPLVGALLVAFVPTDVIGPVVVVSMIAMIPPIWFGVAAALSELDP